MASVRIGFPCSDGVASSVAYVVAPREAAFAAMAASGSGGLASISSGVSEALITTAFGLIVAIPAVWLFNYFQIKIDNLTAEMTYTSKEMIDYMIKNVTGTGEFGRSRFTREFNTTATAGNSPISQ